MHIYGRKDPAYEESLNLKRMCEPRGRLEFDHGGGHEIPRGRVETEQMARAVKKGLERAMASH